MRRTTVLVVAALTVALGSASAAQALQPDENGWYKTGQTT
jgi:opacity protein-like surface antigen